LQVAGLHRALPGVAVYLESQQEAQRKAKAAEAEAKRKADEAAAEARRQAEEQREEQARVEETRLHNENVAFALAERQTAMADPWTYLHPQESPDARRETARSRAEMALARSGAPSRLWSNERARLPNPDAFDTAIRAVLDPDKDGLFLFGVTGRGKSRSALAAVLALALTRRGRHGPVPDACALWVDAANLVARAGTAARSEDAWNRLVESVSNPRILVLDDLGHRLPQTAADALLAILKVRLDGIHGYYTTIVTSQFTVGQLEKRDQTHAAIVRRFKECLVPIKFAHPGEEKPVPTKK
jgi:DNA replication protein DnaC